MHQSAGSITQSPSEHMYLKQALLQEKTDHIFSPLFERNRESVYQLLSQTTPENTSKNYSAYSINPSTRYPNVNMSSIKPAQVTIINISVAQIYIYFIYT